MDRDSSVKSQNSHSIARYASQDDSAGYSDQSSNLSRASPASSFESSLGHSEKSPSQQISLFRMQTISENSGSKSSNQSSKTERRDKRYNVGLCRAYPTRIIKGNYKTEVKEEVQL